MNLIATVNNIYPRGYKSKKFMRELSLLESKETTGAIPLGEQTKTQTRTAHSLGLNWKDSPSTQHLLDAISSIIAREFIMIAKQNPAIFSEIASPPSGVRNDRR